MRICLSRVYLFDFIKEDTLWLPEDTKDTKQKGTQCPPGCFLWPWCITAPCKGRDTWSMCFCAMKLKQGMIFPKKTHIWVYLKVVSTVLLQPYIKWFCPYAGLMTKAPFLRKKKPCFIILFLSYSWVWDKFFKSLSLPPWMYEITGYLVAVRFGHLGRILGSKWFGCRFQGLPTQRQYELNEF